MRCRDGAEEASYSKILPIFRTNCNVFILQGDAISLLNYNFQDRVENVLKYIEDGDIHRWSLLDIRELNCITNPHMYEQGWPHSDFSVNVWFLDMSLCYGFL
ncbi:uncharacterized protein LOC132622117 [Lycium barbarum]|uniref:uncharacterized protein LOC132622117 n=1 Tax=Lycium barbarum TaxID=112863 RepID=UPI00293F3890|nr:uncharacterized protein LOC132622117 [Lycium barbarum]